MIAAMEFEILSTVSLPNIEATAPGLIHTVVSDADGNLYYSDEINHRVVSIDPKGQLRWHRGGKGSLRGQFHYPKGLAIGYVIHTGRRTPCVAACDSWNRRVQVIGLDGDMLEAWGDPDNSYFQEVVDIRFLAQGLDARTGPNTWLILDRGAHRIRLHSDGGEPLGNIGSALPSRLEQPWAQKFIGSVTEAVLQGDADGVRFDPVYYPARVYGDTPDALILWEPLARQLKQVVGRNLLSLGRFPDHPWECVVADRTRYMCWAKADGRIAVFSYDGKAERIAGCPGHPISPAGAEGEVWCQDGSRILRLRWHDAAADARAKRYCSPLHENAVQELEQMRTSADLQESKSQLLQAIDRAVGQCRDLWHALCDEQAETINLESRKAQIADSWDVVCRGADQLDRCLGRHSLTFLKVLCLSQADGRSEEPARAPEMIEVWRPLLDILKRRFSQAQELRDWICVSRLDPHLPGHRVPQGKLQFLEDNLEKLLQRLAAEVQIVGRYLSFPFRAQRRGEPESDKELPARSVCSDLRLLTRKSGPGAWLREIDRISLERFSSGPRAGPYGLTTAPDNHVFVVLRLARQILELSATGEVLDAQAVSDPAGDFEPLCVAADARGRLWVTECQKHRVRILERGSGHGRVIVGEDSSGRLSFPHGICRGSDGSMLVADTGNHRILSLSDRGSVQVKAGGMGREPGRLLHPMAVLPDCPPGVDMFWVVDHRNHRVQKFDAAGAAVSVVGSCGPANGDLLLPHDAALSADGCLTVAQHLFTRCLKLFAEDGRELACMDLDYAPGCLCAYGDTLWVTEADGDCIRIYQRA